MTVGHEAVRAAVQAISEHSALQCTCPLAMHACREYGRQASIGDSEGARGEGGAGEGGADEGGAGEGGAGERDAGERGTLECGAGMSGHKARPCQRSAQSLSEAGGGGQRDIRR